MKSLIVFSSSFSFTHSSKTVRHIQMICIPNDCPTIRNVPFWVRAACELRSMSYGSNITVDVISTCTLILALIRSTTVLLDKLNEYACTGTLQRVCCQAGCRITMFKTMTVYDILKHAIYTMAVYVCNWSSNVYSDYCYPT